MSCEGKALGAVLGRSIHGLPSIAAATRQHSLKTVTLSSPNPICRRAALNASARGVVCSAKEEEAYLSPRGNAEILVSHYSQIPSMGCFAFVIHDNAWNPGLTHVPLSPLGLQT